MSRVVRGESADIRTYKTPGAEATGLRGAGSVHFVTARMEGTYTQEDLTEQFELGRQAGHKESIEAAADLREKMVLPLNQGLESIETVLDQLSQFRRELFKESEDDVFEFVRAVCKRVVGYELSVNKDILKGLVTRALEILERERRIEMAISSEDYEFFLQSKPEFLERFKAIEELKISTDPRVPRGQALLASSRVVLDVDSTKMIDHLMDELQQKENIAKPVNADEDTLA